MSFNSWADFENFEEDVKFNHRFIHSPMVDKFLDNIKENLTDRENILALGSMLFRSQIGFQEYKTEGQIGIRGYAFERMKPIVNRGVEGRANPKGISYLYLANDEHTSLAELRPHIGQLISLAKFRINKNLRIVDCYSVPKHYTHVQCIFDPPQEQNDIICAIWNMINNAFTKPVTNNDSSSDYIPTQILAELFKSEGFDGVCFKSAMGSGHNFILFDLNFADVIDCTVKETKSISYDFYDYVHNSFVQKF